MAEPTRLELATSAVTGQRSNQLSYDSTLVIITYNQNNCKIGQLFDVDYIPGILNESGVEA